MLDTPPQLYVELRCFLALTSEGTEILAKGIAVFLFLFELDFDESDLAIDGALLVLADRSLLLAKLPPALAVAPNLYRESSHFFSSFLRRLEAPTAGRGLTSTFRCFGDLFSTKRGAF